MCCHNPLGRHWPWEPPDCCHVHAGSLPANSDQGEPAQPSEGWTVQEQTLAADLAAEMARQEPDAMTSQFRRHRHRL